ncbi:MAG TPA: CopG family ribbon-helix-helix protein [Conexivisphaerales archaeon]|nr:CopG family ribbon-helix-helix protein [Conexivisphaerales archaeon]
MPIVSLSFPQQMVDEMDAVQKSLGFTGRSELVRASIRLLLQDVRDKSAITGRVSAVVVLTHREENEETVTRIKHKFDDIVRTHIHNKTAKDACVELFLLEGDGAEVTAMTNEFQREDGIRSVRLLVI